MAKKKIDVEIVSDSRSHRYRSAVTGKFVSWWYALTHPRETVRERRQK
jgi:hypothetical protein